MESNEHFLAETQNKLVSIVARSSQIHGACMGLLVGARQGAATHVRGGAQGGGTYAAQVDSIRMLESEGTISCQCGGRQTQDMKKICASDSLLRERYVGVG